MLLIKTKLDVSPIHGIGLFADEFIAEGRIIWKFHSLFDLRFGENYIDELAAGALAQVRKYSYREIHSGLYVLCGDDARFFNHSENPNCFDFCSAEGQDLTVALRDIRIGEELTCNYALFDLDFIEGKYEIAFAEPSQTICKAETAVENY
jgi:uncharacterized protein